MQPEEKFNKAIQAQLSASEFRAQLRQTSALMNAKRIKARDLYGNYELARLRASYTKWKVNDNLDKFLIDFEASVVRKGGKVIWAYDVQNAQQEILQIAQKHQNGKILYSRSALSDEIALSDYFKSNSIPIKAVDFADFIIDESQAELFTENMPLLATDAQQVRNKLNASIRVSIDADTSDIASDIRQHLRQDFYKADLAITGATFLIAEGGLVVQSENSAASRMSYTFAKTHLVIAGIDQLLPSLNEFDLFTTLYASQKTGENLQSYLTVTSPTDRDDIDGPSDFIVLLLDNGRSNVLASPDQRQALSCIDCGACNDVCQVFNYVGASANYQHFQSGPISQVVKPLKSGLKAYGFLSEHSTLCGNCTDVCPLNIDIHNHLIRNRRDAIAEGAIETSERFSWFSWSKLMLSRKNMNRQSSLRNFTFKSFFRKQWGEERELPKIAEKSFNQIWRERNGL
jgi:L-lactate dehydrogenase complex protein LldF